MSAVAAAVVAVAFQPVRQACATIGEPRRVRQAGDAVRGAVELHGARGRDLRHRRRPAAPGPRPGRGDRRERGARVAFRRQRAPTSRCVAGRTARCRRSLSTGPPPCRPSPSRERAFPVRHGGELLGAISVVTSPSDPLGPDRQRLVEDVAAQTALVLRNVRSDRGTARFAPPHRRGAGRTREGPGAEHPRRRAAATGRARGEAAAGRVARRPRPREGEGDARRHPGRDAGGARDPARPGARHLSAAARRPGTRRRARVAGRARPRSRSTVRRTASVGIRRRSSPPSTSAASRPCRTSRSTPRAHAGPFAAVGRRQARSASRYATTARASIRAARRSAAACRA